jgi:hypothetical protein
VLLSQRLDDVVDLGERLATLHEVVGGRVNVGLQGERPSRSDPPPANALPSYALLDQGGVASLRRVGPTRAGRAALAGRPGRRGRGLDCGTRESHKGTS